MKYSPHKHQGNKLATRFSESNINALVKDDECVNMLIYGIKLIKYNSNYENPKKKIIYILEEDLRYL